MELLRVVDGPLAGWRTPVAEELIVGRTDAGLTVPDEAVSARHLRIRRDGNGLQAEDLGSRNGTLLNGRRLTGTVGLQPGDVLVVGSTTIVVEAGAISAAAVRRPPRQPVALTAASLIVALTVIVLVAYFAMR